MQRNNDNNPNRPRHVDKFINGVSMAVGGRGVSYRCNI
jgi:hypothetical protein